MPENDPIITSQKPTIVFEALPDGKIKMLSHSLAKTDGNFTLLKGQHLDVYWHEGKVCARVSDPMIITKDDVTPPWEDEEPEGAPASGEEGT
jgi:hypothetical protein